jgi:tripartite-type tricarboxylate transporter receptor subunit TctC
VAKLNADLNRILSLPDTQRRLTEVGVDATPSSPEQFADFIKSETQTWARVVRDAKVPQQ